MVLSIFRLIVNDLMPVKCASCGQPLSADKISDPSHLCSFCLEPFQMSPFEEAALSDSICFRCGEIIDPQRLCKTMCVNCLSSPMPIRFVRSFFYYNDYTNGILKKLKYCGNYSLGSCLGRMMANKARKLFAKTDWDLILPIPSSRSILSDRGYNHTGLMSQAFAKIVAVKSSMLILGVCGNRKPQASLGLEEREKNMQNVFKVKKKRISGLRVLLIDDTITSGATMLSAAKTLLANGARSVDVFSFLRSQSFPIARQQIKNL